MARHLLTACLAAALSGCNMFAGVPTVGEAAHLHAVDTPPAPVTFLLLDGLSIINTKKTLDDHVIGWIADQDCSTVRASRGEKYCQDFPKPVPVVARTSYCYKTLASVSCYDRPLERDSARLYGTRVDDIPVSAR